MKPPYKITVFGAFRLTGANGAECPVSSKRAKCLIVALLLSPHWSRDRAFLQELLWPDRPSENASLSLRQEISNLRKLFGSDLIVTEQTYLRLNKAFVSNDPLADTGPGAALLEGVELPGALGQWVRDVRQNWNKPDALIQTNTITPVITFSRGQTAFDPEDSGLLVSDLISKGLKDLGPVEMAADVAAGLAAERPVGPAGGFSALSLSFSIEQFQNADRKSMRLALLEHSNARLRWSANWHQVLSDLGADGAAGEEVRTKFFQLAYRAQEAAENALIDIVENDARVCALVLVFQSMREAFSMEPDRVAASEKMLGLAEEIQPSGAILALKSLLRTNQIFERSAPDDAAARSEALEHARRALALEPENSLVRALCSNTLVALAGDTHTGGTYAREAIELNPSNPLAWSTLANVYVAEGRLQEAAQASARALEISRYSKNRHWWEMNSCVAAVARGDFSAAREHARMAHFLAPSFKPPLRFMVSLAYEANDLPEFEDSKRKLKQLEPDFDERHFDDPDYPTSALRKAGLSKMKRLWI